MGREIRRVPVDFVHPTSEYGHPQPMFDRTAAAADAEWEVERQEFLAGPEALEVWTQKEIDELIASHPHHAEEFSVTKAGDLKYPSVEEYIGSRPSDNAAYYQPEGWPPEEARGWVVYETVSEGSPVTPCFATAKELILHLAEEGTTADPPMSYAAAEAFVENGWAPSMIMHGGVISSGLASYEPGKPLAKSEEGDS